MLKSTHAPQGRKQLALMLLLLAVMFLLSWLPYCASKLYFDIYRERSSDLHTSMLISNLVNLLSHSHSAQNPFLYCVMNRPFKRQLHRLFGCSKRCRNSQLHDASTKQVGMALVKTQYTTCQPGLMASNNKQTNFNFLSHNSSFSFQDYSHLRFLKT